MRSHDIPAAWAAAFLAIVATAGHACADAASGGAYSCRDLWDMRNSIYKSAGYCFKQPDAIRQFGNAGCQYDDVADVPISDNDRSMLSDIKRNEAQLGCK